LTVVTGSNTNNVQLRRNSGTTNDYAQLGFRISTNENVGNLAEIRGIRTNRVADADTDITFLTSSAGANPTEKMRIRNDGNVGIGTSSPATLLSLNTSTGVNVNISSALNGSINFGNNSVFKAPTIYGKSDDNISLTFIGASYDAHNIGDVVFDARKGDNTDFSTLTNKAFVFRRFGNEIMSIRRDGLVGINEGSPSAQLQVKSGATTRVPLIVDTIASHATNLQEWRVNGGTALARISSSGTFVTNGSIFVEDGITTSSGVNSSRILPASTGTTISRNIADTNPALIVNLANASATGNIQVWQKAGVALAEIRNDGAIRVPTVDSTSGFNDARMSLSSTGIEIRRNVNDANIVLRVQQVNTSATGDLQDWRLGTNVVASVNKDGLSNFTGTLSNAQTGDYTLVLADKGKVLRINSATNRTVTIPLNSSVAFPIDTEIAILRYGSGTVSISPTSGVTLNSVSSNRKVKDQYGSVALKKIGTDEWVLVGSLEA
jgi:hypothetical protein